jgi:CRP-like cAMP-binding protein
MPLIQDDHMVQQVASATSHPALRHTVLPRTAKGRASWLASDVPHSRKHLNSKLCVAVE